MHQRGQRRGRFPIAVQHRHADADGEIREAAQHAIVIGDVQPMPGGEVERDKAGAAGADQKKSTPDSSLR